MTRIQSKRELQEDPSPEVPYKKVRDMTTIKISVELGASTAFASASSSTGRALTTVSAEGCAPTGRELLEIARQARQELESGAFCVDEVEADAGSETDSDSAGEDQDECSTTLDQSDQQWLVRRYFEAAISALAKDKSDFALYIRARLELASLLRLPDMAREVQEELSSRKVDNYEECEQYVLCVEASCTLFDLLGDEDEDDDDNDNYDGDDDDDASESGNGPTMTNSQRVLFDEELLPLMKTALAYFIAHDENTACVSAILSTFLARAGDFPDAVECLGKLVDELPDPASPIKEVCQLHIAFHTAENRADLDEGTSLLSLCDRIRAYARNEGQYSAELLEKFAASLTKLSCSSTASDDLALQAFDESVKMYELILVSDPEHEMARDVINAVRDFPGEISVSSDNARDVDG